MASNRHLGRIIALQTLYEDEFRRESGDVDCQITEILARNIDRYKDMVDDIKFIERVTNGVSESIEQLDNIIQFADINEFIDTKLKFFSSGMVARLGFAVAVHVNPEVLLVDEVLAVGDANFHEKCYSKIDEFKRQGVTIFFVSHDLEAVARVCDRVIWIDQHEVREDGRPDEVIEHYENFESKR